jgi:glycosyltransferase 2 family protein
VVVVLSVVASLLARAARWQICFLPDRRVAFRPALSTLTISYMASTFLPFRAGELVRAVFLGHREDMPVPRVLGTILLEKLFDFLGIGVLLVILLAIAPELPSQARGAGQFIVLAILLGFGFVVALAMWREPTLRLFAFFDRHLPFGLSQRVRLTVIAGHFAEGTDSLREPRLWISLLGWTGITWTLSVVGSWAGTEALNLHADLGALILLSVLPSAAQSLPSSPGYVGVYHAAAALALTSFGVDQTAAVATAVLIHAASYGILVVLGLVALWVDGYSIGDLRASLRRAPPVAPAAVRLAPDP